MVLPAPVGPTIATVLPGFGHLVLRRTRTGVAILGLFLLAVATLAFLALRADRSGLQLPDAGVADAHAAAVGQQGAGGLAR